LFSGSLKEHCLNPGKNNPLYFVLSTNVNTQSVLYPYNLAIVTVPFSSDYSVGSNNVCAPLSLALLYIPDASLTLNATSLTPSP